MDRKDNKLNFICRPFPRRRRPVYIAASFEST